MGRKRAASHLFLSRDKIRSQEAVADLLEAVSSLVTDLTECPSDGKTRKIKKIIKIINQPVPPSNDQYAFANDSSMDSEENEMADEDDDNHRHKHQRRELSGLPMPNENRTSVEEPSTEQPTKKRVRPFDHSSMFDKRHFWSNNPFHSRGTVGPSTMKTGFPRQWCPDFEELGYCHRGDMCPMEHGANCIMVEDVQSLHQLKLVGVQPDTVPKPITLKDPLRLNGVLASAITAPDADAYDPDQPLWANRQSVDSPKYTSAGTTTAPDVYDPDQPLWANGQSVDSPKYTGAGTTTAPDAYDPDQPLWANGQSMDSPKYTGAGTTTAPDAYDPDQPLWANGQSVDSPKYTSAGTTTAPDAYDPDQPLWANEQFVDSPEYTSAGTATAPDAYDPDQPLWANRQSVDSPNCTGAGTATAPDADLYDPDQPLWANGQLMASPNRTSAGTATCASTNKPSYHLNPCTSVWSRIGNTGAGCQRASSV